MADTQKAPGVMRGLGPGLSPDAVEDNTLSSLLELSRTCEALQQKNSVPTPPPTPLLNNISRAKAEQEMQQQQQQQQTQQQQQLPNGALDDSDALMLCPTSKLKASSPPPPALDAHHHTNSIAEDDLSSAEYEDEDEEDEYDYSNVAMTTAPVSSGYRSPHHDVNHAQLNSRGHYQDQEEDYLSDGETFDGKIVYNPDGSAYIIEGESELSDADSLLDVHKLEGSIVDHRGKPATSQIPAFPQIANAFYIHKNPSAFYNSYFMFPDQSRPKPVAPIMHSFKVYDLRTQKANDKVEENNKTLKAAKEDPAAVPTKPILMCFICKLSFGYTKSFMAHAVGEHNMSLMEEERDIMAKKNASAIIQGVGKEKTPLMSFLEPTAAAVCTTEPTSRPYNPPPPLYNPSQSAASPAAPRNLSTTASSSTSVSYVYANAKVTPVEHVSKDRTDDDGASSTPAETGDQSGPPQSPMSSAMSPRISSRPPSHTWALPSPQKPEGSPRGTSPRYHSPTTSSVADRNCTTPKRLQDEDSLYRPYDNESPRSSEHQRVPSDMPSPYKMSPGSADNSMYHPASRSSPATPLHMPGSSPSAKLSPNSSTSPQMDGQTPGIVIRSGCEDHPQGNISGVECPKCDLILGSTRSLGGHMTMMHSRNSCKTLKCPKCNWHYKYQETLEIHMKEKHPENDTQCIYCLTSQPHPRLARGEVYTCGYKPYRCEVCNYSTTTKGNLSIHMQSDKHINNMQEIQNGTVQNPAEVKMPPTQPPPPPPPPLTPDPKKNKPKPTWRCDVCNYETNVARNLRIHMTSEKHTHNMLVLQQNVKHMQRDMQFQMSQLALMGQDPLAMMAGIPPGMAPGMPPFPFEQMMMGGPMPGGNPNMMENPVDLTKQQQQENGLIPSAGGNGSAGHPMDLKNNNNAESCRIFQCSVCNLFSTDSLESLHQHMQLDRSKPVSSEQDDTVTNIGGTYLCNLCQYKTNLKANFQLHCKTDKHLQRLQLLNHIREGGPANEWRLKYMSAGNPIQVRCNSCDYYTNSIHKLQLHRTNPRHESNAKLFHHLQAKETCLNGEAMRYYHCSLCSFNTRAKINLIQHVRSMKHMRNESLRLIQLKEQGKEHQYLLENVFQVREYTESDIVKFDQTDGEPIDGCPIQDGDLPPEFAIENAFREAAELNNKGGVGKLYCPFCTFSTTNEMQIQLHVQTQHLGATQGGMVTPGGPPNTGPAPHKDLACPLCQEKCGQVSDLEKHLLQVHSVSSEGMHRLLAMVFTPEGPQTNSSQSQTKNSATTTTVSSAKKPSNATKEATSTKDTVVKTDPDASPVHRESPMSQEASTPTEDEDLPMDPMELQAEMFENQALKLAEEASMDGVVLGEKDADDQYRCQTCSKTFINIDALYSHQNELGHLELKQTPRGPGYLCWKKGCNQYFKTGEALQVHFREIHVSLSSQTVSVSERHAYKFRCTQCSLAFKTLEKLQLHSFYHIIRAATKCVVCSKCFRSISAMKRHVETKHLESMTPTEMEQYRSNLAATAPLGFLGMPMPDPMMMSAMAAGQLPPLIPLGAQMPMPPINIMPLENQTKDLSPKEREDEEHSSKADSAESQDPEAEQEADDDQETPMDADDAFSMHDPDGQGDYKDQQFMEDYVNSQAIAENSYSDPSRKYKCHRCKVAFTKQNYLSAHNKTLMHRKGDKVNYPLEKYMDPNRPYKCEVCKESFTQKNILLVHFNSVSHLHKMKQQQQGGDEADQAMDTTENLTDNGPSNNNDSPTSSPVAATTSSPASTPDEKKPYKCNICKVSYSQSATMDIHIRSVLHQTRASKLQELASSGQVDLSQPLIEQPETSQTKAQMALQEQQRKLLQEMNSRKPPTLVPASSTANSAASSAPLMSPPPLVPVQTDSAAPSPRTTTPSSSNANTTTTSATPSTPTNQLVKVKLEDNPFSCLKCNSSFPSQESLVQHQQLLCYSQQALLRGMPRFKPQVQKNLLENIGFECVMQFNEFYQRVKPESKEAEDAKPNGPTKPKVEKVYDNLPEMNKCKCGECNKEFSSIWVLKAHQEEVHKQLLPIEYIEDFSVSFKEQYEKKQEAAVVALQNSTAEAEANQRQTETPSSPNKTAAADIVKNLPHGFLDDKKMPMPNLATDLAMAQAMQMMQMPMFMNNMMPFGMPMGNIPMSMNMIPPLMPMMMPMAPEMMGASAAGLQMMDPNMMMAQQQQAAAIAAQQQKRARTRINDEQLKILRTYFDINNSPTEEQIMEMAEKSGLPPKVIKHWFRNTLFKERQRNKDSPYNFSIPPSTSLNLEEYEKTGKVEDDEQQQLDKQKQQLEKQQQAIEKQHRMEMERLEQLQKQKMKSAEKSEPTPKMINESIRHKPQPPQHHHQEISSQSKPKISEDARPSSRAIAENHHDNMDRESVASVGESIVSSAPSTPAPHAQPAMPMTPILPPPSLAGLTPPGVSFAEFSAALQGLPVGPSITTHARHGPVPSTPQHSTPVPPRSQPSMSPCHNSMSGKRANRTRFTDYQIKVLQEYFEQNAYPKDDDLEHLSRLLNLSPRVIVVWFQNARQKARKNYENQPPLDMSTEESSKFTRTPGLNYQCKKCFTVFQRYYELIKHQRTHCYKDEKKLPFNFTSVGGKSGQSSTSFDESDESGDSGRINNNNNEPRPEVHSPRASIAPPTSTIKSTPATPSAPTTPTATPNKPGIEYKCEKCNLVLPRLELWREHQNIHNMNPSLFGPFSNSAFAMLQNVAQQQPAPKTSSAPTMQQQVMAGLDENMPMKRHLEEYDDDRDEQGQSRDKRMRTTILPEQLDYLYQKYQLDCNPSRKQLENIAQEVGLKKRVVQVWFQNTRARERKGQFRAHQQLIHKRCPFCRALFRAKSALESHLATKHPDEMAKGDINIDNIPDEMETSEDHTSPGPPGLDMAKLLNNPYNMPNPLMPMVPSVAPGAPMPGSHDQVQNNMKKLYEDSLKKYLDELSHASHKPKPSAFSPDSNRMPNVKQEQDDTPLDLSKPQPQVKMELGQHNFSMEMSEMSDSSEMDEMSLMDCYSNPPSPSSSTCSNKQPGMGYGSGGMPHKRYRTQMSSLQIRLMKNLFVHYKTPTMAECELVGREIGLAKRVVQVWFQNARAKEKKAKLNYAKALGGAQLPESEFQRPPDECTLCNFKYSHKYTVQDHIFTRKHIDKVKQLVQNQAELETGVPAGKDRDPWSMSGSTSSGGEGSTSSASHPHLAHLHAMGLQALNTQQPGSSSSVSKEKSSSKTSVGKPQSEQKDGDNKKPSGPPNAALPPGLLAAAAAYGGAGGLPGLPPPHGAPGADLSMAAAAGMLPFLYPGMGGPLPPGMPLIPGMMPGPEMLMYDPTTFGTPLTLLQIPQQAIQEVQAQVQDPACTITRYTQDCLSQADVKSMIRPADLALIQEAYLDVGFICKKCHMVYPGRDACAAHQVQVCYQGKNLAQVKSTLKLEQTQYKCTACREKFSTVAELYAHCKSDAHQSKASECRPESRASNPTSSSSRASTPRTHGDTITETTA